MKSCECETVGIKERKISKYRVCHHDILTLLPKKDALIFKLNTIFSQIKTNFKNIFWSNLIWSPSILWSFQLNLESFHPDLEAIHGLYCRLGTGLVVETNEPKALALVGGTVNEDLAADDISKGEKHLHQLRISELLWQMVDKQIATLRSAQ